MRAPPPARRNEGSASNKLHHLRTERHAESVRGVTNIGVVTIAVGRPHISRIVLPGARAQDMSAAVPAAPCRAVGGRALIGLVPAVLDPLIDTAAHVVEPERIRLEASGLRGLVVRETTAILATGHARLQL